MTAAMPCTSEASKLSLSLSQRLFTPLFRLDCISLRAHALLQSAKGWGSGTARKGDDGTEVGAEGEREVECDAAEEHATVHPEALHVPNRRKKKTLEVPAARRKASGNAGQRVSSRRFAWWDQGEGDIVGPRGKRFS